jgi:putative aminopeptidase FrvX
VELLKKLCQIHAPSGNEEAMTRFLLDYIHDQKKSWKSEPQIHSGDDFQNCILLIFGKPRTAVYAHIDSIGFTVRYNNQLVKIGAPEVKNGIMLKGFWEGKEIEAPIKIMGERNIIVEAKHKLEPGIDLTFKDIWRENKESIQCCYMDNRLGVWTALKLCETIENGAIAFSCWEEHGGGSVSYLSRFLYENYKIRQSLICDITWVTEGVRPGKGVVISMRDIGIPRRKFVNKIVELAKESGIPFQKEVEGSGGSDGTELQKQPYPIDWCFVGAPEENVHSPDEKVNKEDIKSMLEMYKYLVDKL